MTTMKTSCLNMKRKMLRKAPCLTRRRKRKRMIHIASPEGNQKKGPRQAREEKRGERLYKHQHLSKRSRWVVCVVVWFFGAPHHNTPEHTTHPNTQHTQVGASTSGRPPLPSTTSKARSAARNPLTPTPWPLKTPTQGPGSTPSGPATPGTAATPSSASRAGMCGVYGSGVLFGGVGGVHRRVCVLMMMYALGMHLYSTSCIILGRSHRVSSSPSHPCLHHTLSHGTQHCWQLVMRSAGRIVWPPNSHSCFRKILEMPMGGSLTMLTMTPVPCIYLEHGLSNTRWGV